MSAPKPPVIPQPFANNAGPSFINDIPDTTATPGLASYDQGFPPITMQPVAAGGVPPEGQDFNGILFALSSHDYYVQAGQLFQYDADVVAAISGYAVGTILGSSDGFSIWGNIAAGNTTDPDNDSTGAGWSPVWSKPAIPPVGPGGVVTGGTVTVPPSIARFRTLSVNGTLTGNAAIVMPSGAAWVGVRWLIINNTSGAFNVTVRTAAGTGVNIPQAGLANPVEVYGDGTNIYTVTPSSGLIPVDQAATPLTLVERTNNGYVYGQFFNMANAAVDNSTATYVITDNGDSFFRRNTLANFEGQLVLSALGGQVTAAQVPQAAVTQYTPAVLASAALTGTPTTPTATAGTSNTQVASCAFVLPAFSSAVNGYRKMADGTIEQWGRATISGTTVVNFNTPFITQAYNVTLTPINSTNQFNLATAPGLNSFTVQNGNADVFWRAVGK